jgi:hypothetical protein
VLSLLDRKATGCHLLSSLEYWDRMASVVRYKLLALIHNGSESVGSIKTGADVTRHRSSSNACYCSPSHFQGALPVMS